MEYIKEGYTLPVPINIIPTSVAIIEFFKNIRRRLTSSNVTGRSGSLSHTALDDPVSQYELKSQISGNNFNVNTIDLPYKNPNTVEGTLRNTPMSKVT